MKRRTETFFVCHFRNGKPYAEKVRGYVRNYSNVESGKQIEIGIYRDSGMWQCVEKSTGLRTGRTDYLTDAFNMFLSDKMIDSIHDSANRDTVNVTLARETIRQAEENDI